MDSEPKRNAGVLDACCGSKMFHFEKDSPDVVYIDNRSGVFNSRDPDRRGGVRVVRVRPDVVADFRALPFADGRFRVVIFDPPHLRSIGDRSIMRALYGRLPEDFQALIAQGFRECFRVLAPHGLLIFKWSAVQIPVSKILILTPHRPLVGQRCGKSARTHWVIFKKEEAA
jgi:SAM-dependent methyltransferase